MLTRQQILLALQQALEPLNHVHAMWEGGSAAFGHADEWSDVDVQIVVEDERVADAFTAAEAALLALSPFEIRWEVPQPAWHGHAQVFYKLQNASPYLMVDFVVMKASNPNKFLEPEIHGQATVLFDKNNALAVAPLDWAALHQQLAARLEQLRLTFPLFQSLTQKSVHRGWALEAVAFYNAFTLRPLMEVLRIKHSPAHHNWHVKVAHFDLPPEVFAQVEPLFFPRDLADLAAKRTEAERLFYATLASLEEVS